MRSCPLCHRPDVKIQTNVDDFQIVECSNCQFVFLGNPPDHDTEEQNYERYFQHSSPGEYSPQSPRYDLRQMWQINEKRLSLIKKYQPVGKLLDIGCGWGYFLEHANREGYSSEGVDISHTAAQHASYNVEAMIHVCNIEREVPFDGPFDVITMWHVLEHFHDPLATLDHINSLLTPTGKLFIEVPNYNSLKFKLSRDTNKWQGGNHPQYHRSFFTRETLNRALRSTGFHHIRSPHLVYDADHPFPVKAAKHVLQYAQRDSFLTSVAWF